MYFVYILYSPSKDKFYVGYTNNLEETIDRHNKKRFGFRKFTRQVSDWQLKYYEIFENKNDALKREKEIKRKKSRKYLEKLIQDSRTTSRVYETREDAGANPAPATRVFYCKEL